MSSSHPGGNERGAVLIVTLMFLVILTLLGVTAMTSTTMEERMAGNTRDSAIALQAAESALRDARRDISNIPVSGTVRGGIPISVGDFGDKNRTPGSCRTDVAELRGLCVPLEHERKIGSILPNVPATHSLSAAPSLRYGEMTGAFELGGDDKPIPATEPRYLIEGFCMLADGESLQPVCKFYRITARGYGRNPNTQVTLQETFISL